MTNAKSIVAGTLLALLIQYPITLALVAVPAVVGGASFSEFTRFIAFYWFWVTIVATPVILFIGLPLFLWLRARSSASIRNTLILGAIVAATLAAVSTWVFFPGEGFSSGEKYYGTYRDMIIDGVPTFWGWVSMLEDVLLFAIHGALGALFFRVGWRKYEAANPINGYST